MKRTLLILAMLLMAATSYNQTSKRTSNANGSATRKSEGTTTTNSRSQGSSATKTTTSTATRSTEDHKNSQGQGQNQHNTGSGTQAQSNHSNDNRGNGENNGHDNRSTDEHNGYGNHHNDNYNNNNNHNDNYGHDRYNEGANSHHHNDVYVSYPSTRIYHGTHTATHAYRSAPYDRNYRAEHYAYREPNHVNIYWTRDMHRHYIEMYPEITYWHYYDGYRINSTSAYYADNYIGEVMNVYGKVSEVYYSFETDEFFLYIGDYYPYHDFTIVIPGTIARRFNNVPEYYFTNQFINVTGLITAFNGKPEIVVKRDFQFEVY